MLPISLTNLTKTITTPPTMAKSKYSNKVNNTIIKIITLITDQTQPLTILAKLIACEIL